MSGGRPPARGVSLQSLLLVVVGMLAVFCLDVIVAMRRTDGEYRYRRSCAGHLKMIGFAFKMYRDDHNGCWPPGDDWCVLLQPYTNERGVFRCPQLPREKWGYGYNARLAGLRERQVAEPIEVSAAFDAKPGMGGLAGGLEVADPRHNGGVNVLFADGHVKGEADPKSLCWDRAYGSGPPR
jgi:prepilin-type processing-associated H-X9-DG protein